MDGTRQTSPHGAGIFLGFLIAALWWPARAAGSGEAGAPPLRYTLESGHVIGFEPGMM